MKRNPKLPKGTPEPNASRHRNFPLKSHLLTTKRIYKSHTFKENCRTADVVLVEETHPLAFECSSNLK
jgi:hypothetical protein